MAVAKQNLSVYQGADYDQVLEFRDNTSTLMDLTGYAFRGQARVAYTDNDPAFSFDFTIRTQSGGNLGLVDMNIAPASTAALSISKITKYLYDIEMVDTNGKVTRILEGQVSVFPEVTK